MAGPGSYSTAFGSIPFADVPEGTDVSTKFLAGATLGAAINKNRQQLENQLQQLVLRNQAMELGQYNRDRNFMLAQYLGNQRLDIAQQRMEGWRERAQEMTDLANRAQDLKDKDQQRKQDLADMRLNQADAAYQAGQIPFQLDQAGIPRGSAAWLAKYNEKRAGIYGIPNALATSIDRNAYNQYNMDAQALVKAQTAKEKAFYRDVQDKVWGDGITTDLNPIFDPNNPAYKHPMQGIYGFRKPVQDQLVIGKVKIGNDVVDRTVSVQTLQEMKKRWDDLEKSKQDIGTPVTDPHVGVYPGRPETDAEKAKRILSDTTNPPQIQRAAQALIDPEASQEDKAAAQKILMGR